MELTVYFVRFCLVQVQLFLLLDANATQLNGTFYNNHGHFLMQTIFKTHYACSIVACCELCSNEVGCETISFKSSSGECLLSTIPALGVEFDSIASTDWITYSQRNGRKIRLGLKAIALTNFARSISLHPFMI